MKKLDEVILCMLVTAICLLLRFSVILVGSHADSSDAQSRPDLRLGQLAVFIRPPRDLLSRERIPVGSVIGG